MRVKANRSPPLATGRALQPELLDSLSPDDPAALRSRRDLRIINLIMGNRGWFRHELRRRLHPGERILELGAGSGEMGLALSAEGFVIDGLDTCPRPPRWPRLQRWHRTDLRSFDRYAEYAAVMANLTLHHFTAVELAALGRQFSGARLILASEPARCRRSQVLFAVFGRMLGANRITLHDARVSIAAGFLREELPHALSLTKPTWGWKCGVSTLGAYRMIALRR